MNPEIPNDDHLNNLIDCIRIELRERAAHMRQTMPDANKARLQVTIDSDDQGVPSTPMFVASAWIPSFHCAAKAGPWTDAAQKLSLEVAYQRGLERFKADIGYVPRREIDDDEESESMRAVISEAQERRERLELEETVNERYRGDRLECDQRPDRFEMR